MGNMGLCTSSAQQIDFAINLEWTPIELGDYILDMEKHEINVCFKGFDTKPRSQLNDVLSMSLFYLLVYKNHIANPDHQRVQISNKIEPYRLNHKLESDVEPIAKWMLENKIPKSQTEIRQDNYPETIGKWFDEYTKAMSSL